MTDFNSDELAALQSGGMRVGVFLNLATTPPVRLWAGIGAIALGVNIADPAGATYLGFGEMVDVPAFEQFLNGQASHVTFTLSGVSGAVVAMAGNDAPSIKHKVCRIGMMLFDQAWRPIGVIHWLMRAYGETIETRQASDAEGKIVRSLSLTIGTRFTGRRSPALSFYTDVEQRGRSSGDRFCERTIHYSRDVSKAWPIF